jgi:hypothetical protein
MANTFSVPRRFPAWPGRRSRTSQLRSLVSADRSACHRAWSRPDHDPAPVRDLGRAAPATPRPTERYELRPQLAVLATARDDPADWLRAGQALQRVLLTATVSGLAASFLYQPIELHDMRQSTGWWPWPECPQIILRLGYGPTNAGSPKRRVDDILDRSAGAPGTTAWPLS